MRTFTKTIIAFILTILLFGCQKGALNKRIGTDNDVTLPYLERVTSHVYKSFSKDKSQVYALLLNMDFSFQMNIIDSKNEVTDMIQGQWSELNAKNILLEGKSEKGTAFSHEAEIVDDGTFINIYISKDSILELEALGF
ncbi:MAG: hypothetical protein WCU80_02870 [Paludibacteraceae bacterium]|nr:hypothetical protein [Prevotellaceae bacterium]